MSDGLFSAKLSSKLKDYFFCLAASLSSSNQVILFDVFSDSYHCIHIYIILVSFVCPFQFDRQRNTASMVS